MPAEAARLQAEASPFRVRQSGGPREAEAAKERLCPGDLGTLRVAVNRRERSRQRRTKAAVEPPDRRHGQSQHDVEAWIMGPTKSSGALSRASPKPTIMVAAKVMGMAQGARFPKRLAQRPNAAMARVWPSPKSGGERPATVSAGYGPPYRSGSGISIGGRFLTLPPRPAPGCRPMVPRPRGRSPG